MWVGSLSLSLSVSVDVGVGVRCEVCMVPLRVGGERLTLALALAPAELGHG